MKATKIFLLAGLALIVAISNFSCTKETVSTGYNPQRRLSDLPANTPLLLVWVGTNDYVAYPADSSILNAYAGLNNQNISYFWRKVAGPASYIIHNPDSLVTKIEKLEIGQYDFEITATDINGKKSSDTMSVYVIKPGQNETIFEKFKWICPWGCSIYIKNIYSYIPQNKPLLVFIRPANFTTWLPALPPVFDYSIYNNTFSLYTDDATGKLDVKIQY